MRSSHKPLGSFRLGLELAEGLGERPGIDAALLEIEGDRGVTVAPLSERLRAVSRKARVVDISELLELLDRRLTVGRPDSAPVELRVELGCRVVAARQRPTRDIEGLLARHGLLYAAAAAPFG